MTPRASSQTLTDHKEIRRWAEQRDATPACVRNTGRGKDVGMIRLDFPGYSGAGSLEEISWDEWFGKFDDSNLALIVQNKTARGQRSNFNKIVGRNTAEQGTGRRRGTRRRARARRTGARTRTSARGRSSLAAASTRRRRSARKASASRSAKTVTAKRKTSARRSRSSSRRGGARVVSISVGRSKRVQARAGRKRTTAKSRQSRRRAA